MIRKKFLLFYISICLSVIGLAQSPVGFKYAAKKISDKKYEIRISASVSDGWHIYSQTTPAGGPAPTVITFSKNPLAQLEGELKEVGQLHKKFEEVFDVDVHYYNRKVEFVQIVKLKANAKTILSGTIEYMVCNDEECLPPRTVQFSVAIQ